MRSPSQQPRIIRVFISFALRATRDLDDVEDLEEDLKTLDRLRERS